MSSPDQIKFVDAHHPPLESGTYSIVMDQQVEGSTPGREFKPGLFSATATFRVLGPRTSLAPGTVSSTFPPPADDGDHDGVLPHVELRRATLPWERHAERGEPGGTRAPWLAVLVLTEEEATGPRVAEAQVKRGALSARVDDPAVGPLFPGLSDEEDDPEQVVQVLDLPRRLANRLLPRLPELRYLAHVRERFLCRVPIGAQVESLDEGSLPGGLQETLREHGAHLPADCVVHVEHPGGEWRIDSPSTERVLYVEAVADPAGGPPTHLDVVDQARSVVLSHRVVQRGEQYRAFLVSVEGRYDASDPVQDLGLDPSTRPDPDEPVRLVILHRWSFSVSQDSGHLARLLGELVADAPAPVGAWSVPGRRVRYGRQPSLAPGPIRDLLEVGYTALEHRMREGSRLVSWYRGPLVPREPRVVLPELPVEHGDALLVLDRERGMLDVSYASAWQLGRSLAVANPNLGLALQEWKTARRHEEGRMEAEARATHLPPGAARGAVSLPAGVKDWFQRLAMLEQVPARYLVPEEDLLPRASLRSFWVDERWVDCLLDGAFSAARLLGVRHALDRLLFQELRAAAVAPLGVPGVDPSSIQRTGLLLRSELVSGWPDIQIDGYGVAGLAPDQTPAVGSRRAVLRRSRLADDTLLVVFRGQASTLDIHPNPEALHHALHRSGGAWTVFPRSVDPSDAGSRPTTPVSVPMAPGGDSIDVEAAFGVFSAWRDHPELLALQLIDGVPRLRVELA